MDFSGYYEILSYIGVDFKSFYVGAEFVLTEKGKDESQYKMTFDGDEYVVTVDTQTGIWTKMTCGDKTLMTMKKFDLEKGIIPNH